MNITKEFYGKTKSGKSVDKYTLENSKGITVSIINYGGIITSFKTPDKNGKIDEINLGFETLERYENDSPFFGCLVGRFGNRINAGKFKLDGKEYSLAKNDNKINHLHGGNVGFDKVIWESNTEKTKDSVSLILKYTSPDGEEGYPGKLKTTVTYSLNDNNEFTMDYKAETDKRTPINLTNHAYWNLAGSKSGTIKEHEMMLNCDLYLPVNEGLIPTGEILSVKNTPMDFTKPKKIGQDLDKVKGGYDHCFVVKSIDKKTESNNSPTSIVNSSQEKLLQQLREHRVQRESEPKP